MAVFRELSKKIWGKYGLAPLEKIGPYAYICNNNNLRSTQCKNFVVVRTRSRLTVDALTKEGRACCLEFCLLRFGLPHLGLCFHVTLTLTFITNILTVYYKNFNLCYSSFCCYFSLFLLLLYYN